MLVEPRARRAGAGPGLRRVVPGRRASSPLTMLSHRLGGLADARAARASSSGSRVAAVPAAGCLAASLLGCSRTPGLHVGSKADSLVLLLVGGVVGLARLPRSWPGCCGSTRSPGGIVARVVDLARQTAADLRPDVGAPARRPSTHVNAPQQDAYDVTGTEARQRRTGGRTVGAHLVEPGAVLADRYVVEDLLAQEGDVRVVACARQDAGALGRPPDLLPSVSPYAADLLAAAKRASRVTDTRILQVLDAVDDGELDLHRPRVGDRAVARRRADRGAAACPPGDLADARGRGRDGQRPPDGHPAPPARPRQRGRDEVERRQAGRARHGRGPARRPGRRRRARAARTPSTSAGCSTPA